MVNLSISSDYPVSNSFKTSLFICYLFRERVNKSDFSKRRTGGWADSRNNSFSQKTSSLDKTDHSNDDDDDDLPIIPDLEEVEKEDFAQRVADAPNVAVNRVDTYKELDSDLFKHAAFATLEEVDLRLLTRHMVPEQSLKVVRQTLANTK